MIEVTHEENRPASSPDDDEALLERICQLEKLLSVDKNRKVKFQKPKHQLVWQTELDSLMIDLEKP